MRLDMIDVVQMTIESGCKSFIKILKVWMGSCNYLGFGTHTHAHTHTHTHREREREESTKIMILELAMT